MILFFMGIFYFTKYGFSFVIPEPILKGFFAIKFSMNETGCVQCHFFHLRKVIVFIHVIDYNKYKRTLKGKEIHGKNCRCCKNGKCFNSHSIPSDK